MQSTNTGILKPALWHTPAITKDGIIRQAPDPREKHEGFTPGSQQGVEMRTSSTGLQHTLTYTVHHRPACPGVRSSSAAGTRGCSGFHPRV